MRLTTSAWAVVMMAVVCGEQAVAFSPAMPVTALTNGGARVPPSMSVRMMYDSAHKRRSAIKSLSGALLAPLLRSVSVQAADPVADIRKARNLLDTIPAYIDKEQWDKCRTVVNLPPLGFTGAGSLKDNMEKAAASLGGGMKGAAKGIAQDTLTSVRLLDSFCYTNVFVDEGREILGVKIDKKTPKGYLVDSKANIDSFLELFGDGAEEEGEE